MNSRPLLGLRILNTRPRAQAKPLSRQIRNAGGVVIELPSIEIKPVESGWINLLTHLEQIDQAIFISANAVDCCFAQLKLQQVAWPSSIQSIAIGQATAVALQKWGIAVSAIPEQPDSEHLLALKTLQQPNQQNMLLFKGDGGRLLIEEELVAKGVNLTVLKVYQRTIPQIDHEFIRSLWQDDLVDIILLTSELSLHNLFKLFTSDAYEWLRNKKWLTISERLAQIATGLGIKNIKVCHPNQLMRALFNYVNKD